MHFAILQRNIARYLRTKNTKGIPKKLLGERLEIYRELVVSNIESFIDTRFPICASMLGNKKWRSLVLSFIAEHPISSPYFHQIPTEFLLYLNKQPLKQLPPYLLELAHYEWVELAILTSKNTPLPAFKKKIKLDKPVVLVPISQIYLYRFPVHTFTTKMYKSAVIKRQTKSARTTPIHLVMFRKIDYTLGVREVTAAMALLINACIQTPKKILHRHILTIAKTMNIQQDQCKQFENQAMQNLLTLQREGLILGSKS
ncbi:MAG: putative DNA-binding domain-containing protein [Methylacidiphilales bacterium]|nr:putative DNA-binding domain-containing protein [Candidatus Methylacidiphilales bacterium]